MNQIVIVGRVVEEPTLKGNNDRKLAIITLAVQRKWKNSDGIYETDFLPCILWNSIAGNACDYVHKGDVVGIRGRLQSNNNKIEIIAEQMSYLSSTRKDSE